MTQTDKELLLKDLCTRLPYDVIIHYHWEIKGTDSTIDDDRKLKFSDVESLKYMLTELQDNRFIIEWKPYLRPMSSMTEEEKKEYNEYLFYGASIGLMSNTETAYELIDWLNKKKFDYHCLIPKRLAIEVTKENNPYK